MTELSINQMLALHKQLKPFKGQMITPEMLKGMSLVMKNYHLKMPDYVKVGDVLDNLDIAIVNENHAEKRAFSLSFRGHLPYYAIV